MTRSSQPSNPTALRIFPQPKDPPFFRTNLQPKPPQNTPPCSPLRLPCPILTPALSFLSYDQALSDRHRRHRGSLLRPLRTPRLMPCAKIVEAESTGPITGARVDTRPTFPRVAPPQMDLRPGPMARPAEADSSRIRIAGPYRKASRLGIVAPRSQANTKRRHFRNSLRGFPGAHSSP
jgi:hypothetical protein